MKASDLMTKEYATAHPNDRAIDVGERMYKESLSAVVICEDDDVCGILTKESFLTELDYLKTKDMEDFVVREIMDDDVKNVDPDEDIKLVLDIILEEPHKIGRVLVVGTEDVQGIIEKRSIIQLYVNELPGRFRVRDLMEYKPVTVFDYSPLSYIIEELDLNHGKRMMVLRGEKVVGVITALDLAVKIYEDFKRFAHDDTFMETPAEELMTSDPITVETKTDAAEAGKILLEKNIGGLPAIEDGRLAGVITKTNFVKGYKIYLEKM